jgi:hypothetical protein
VTVSPGPPPAALPRATTWLRSFAAYFDERFPLPSNGTAIVVTFLAVYLLCGSADGGAPLSWKALGGLVTFFLLFLQLRLVDDIDDAERDARERGLDDEAAGRRKRALICGLAGSALGIALLNWGEVALVPAIAATATSVLTPFVVRRWATRGGSDESASLAARLLVGVFYEGTHLVIMLYVCFAWASVTGGTLPATTILAIAGTFWTAFEFWKYSRYVVKPDWRPYGLSWPQARLALTAVLALSLAAQVATVFASRIPRAYLVYAVFVTAATVVWIHRVSPQRPQGPRSALERAKGLVGMTFLGALDLGMLTAVMAPQGARPFH